MSKLYLFWIISRLSGNPLLAGAVILVIWVATDQVTLGLLPSPLRAINRWRRASQLRDNITINPNDRRSRLELSELLIGQRRYAAAVELLKPNLEAGDDDTTTLYALGVGCLGSARWEQGEVFLNAAREQDPSYRLGGADLELGRWRLARGDVRGAREALERLCARRIGTVEGKVLLARAPAADGDPAGATKLLDAAWTDYSSSPRFQQRQDRFWAWRARPSRPLAYLALLLTVGFLFTTWVAPQLSRRTAPHASRAPRDEDD